MIDMWLKYYPDDIGNCPICGKKFNETGHDDGYEYYCTSGCYKLLESYYGSYWIWVFDKKFSFFNYEQHLWAKYRIRVTNHIQYWKENERYLMQILTR
jgi:hypothetical protein